jgi:hypothetical protein
MPPNEVIQPMAARGPRDVSAYRATRYIQAHLFLAATIWALSIWQWPQRWLLSGAPILTYILWPGEATRHRILAYIPLWTLFLLINLTYAVTSTSWLLFAIFLASSYSIILIGSLYQFDAIAHLQDLVSARFLYTSILLMTRLRSSTYLPWRLTLMLEV